MPVEKQFPPDLRKLPSYHAVQYDHLQFDAIIHQIRSYLK